MLPFTLTLIPGVPVYEQIVAAVTRAVVSGALQPGDEFPSVRTLSRALRINPNTAQRAIAALTERGLLSVFPGVGTRVAMPAPSARAVATDAIRPTAETLVVEARTRGMTLDDLLAVLHDEWVRLDRPRRKDRHG